SSQLYCPPRNPHSFPTRRSSDLVVDNQDFHFPVAAVRVCGDLLKRCGEPQLFVVGRNDDGEFAVGGTHRSGGFCQEWCPTRGTKRQPSSVFVENAPACFSMSRSSWLSASPTGMIMRPSSAS